MAQATVYNYGVVLLVYLAGATVLTAIMSRAVIPDERRAGMAFRKGEYGKAAASTKNSSPAAPSPATTRRSRRASTPPATRAEPSKQRTGP